MADKPTILIVGTLDTKLSENQYLRSAILSRSSGSCNVKVLDSGRSPTSSSNSAIPSDEIIAPLSDGKSSNGVSSVPRGQYIEDAIATLTPVVTDLVSSGQIHGIISAAGSSGSALACALMRDACPIGFPKLMVSTMASGDIRPYIGETDITMMYSVVDVEGINSVLKKVLSNAAGAIVGMTQAYFSQTSEGGSEAGGKRVAITMFGVTTPCVKHIQKILTSAPHEASDHEVYVFHATGAGGRAMERLISEGQIDAVVDLTTTEVADHLFGGVLSAGSERLTAAAKRGVPTVVSLGACDMVNFGPRDSVPERYGDGSRELYQHSPTVTVMRTTKSENQQIGSYIAKQLKDHATDESKIRVLIPKGGVSMLDSKDQPFHDAEADEELFKAVGDGLKDTKIEVQQYPEHINDEAFAAQVCEQLLELVGVDPRQYRLANARRRKWSFDHGRSVMLARRASQIEVPDA